MKAVNDFFIPENKIDTFLDGNYNQESVIFKILNSVSRLTSKSIYVIDLYRKNFFYVSNNPLFLCGYSPDEVKEMGFRFYFKIVPEDEISLLLEINRAGFSFFDQIAIDERLKVSASFDFHIQNKEHLLLVNQKMTPIQLDRKGKIWLASCVVSLSHHQDAGNLEIHFEGKPDYRIYSQVDGKWKNQPGLELKNREKEILQLYDQGCIEEKIADKLCINKNTVKFHKRALFEKLGVNSMSAALNAAYDYKLI